MADRSHPAYSLPNYARLFSEAVRDSIRDYYHDNPHLMVPGYWLISRGRRFPYIPARTYWCDHEPGNPENKLDRWPMPYLAGEIGGDEADPLDIFGARLRKPIEPRGGLTDAQEYAFLVADLRYARQWRSDEPAVNPARSITLTAIPPLGPPDDK